MAKRLKHVHGSHSNLAHIWAHCKRLMSEGKCDDWGKSSDGRMFYRGDVMYSYRESFPIALMRPKMLLIAEACYSSTTSRHIRYVENAASHISQLEIPYGILHDVVRHCTSLHDEPKLLKQELRRDAVKLIAALGYRCKSNYTISMRGIKHYGIENTIAGIERDQRTIVRFYHEFKLGCAPVMENYETMLADLRNRAEWRRTGIDPRATPKVQERQRREFTERTLLLARKEKADREERERKQRELIPRWRNGEYVQAYSIRPQMLRMITHKTRDPFSGVYMDHEYIETSGGVKFPLKDGIQAFRILQTVRDYVDSDTLIEHHNNVKEFLFNGKKVTLGNWQIDSVSRQGVRGGCHLIEWAEIDAMARQLGLLEETTTETINPTEKEKDYVTQT